MKYLLIFLSSFITVFFYYYIFDNAALGLVVILFSLLYISSHFDIDRRYCEFIKNVNEVEYSSIEEAIEEFKEDKKYLIRLFSKDNTKVLLNFQKLKVTKKDFDRFIEIQQKKNEFIKECVKKRTIIYAISILINLLSFIPLLYCKQGNASFYYKLYNGGYKYIIFLSIIFILINNCNLNVLNHKNNVDLSLYDNYSLCFHKNCQQILNIQDSRLKYDSKGSSVDIEFQNNERNTYYYSFVTLSLSILISIYFMI